MGIQRLFILCILAIVSLFTVPQYAFAEDAYAGRQQIHVVAWGDNLSSIAARYAISSDELADVNNISADAGLSPGQTLIVPRRSPEREPVQTVSHRVAAGETLYRIAVNYGTTVDALLAANPGVTPETLQAGQTINVPTDTPLPPNGSTYTVQTGDTLSSIGRQFGVTAQDLINVNGLVNAGMIYAGQVLSIPGAANTNTPAYTPSEAAQTYTVQGGDTLFSIANRFSLSTYTLARANNIGNSSLLYAGQVLTIPGGTSSPDSTQGVAPPAPVVATTSNKSIIVDVSDQRTYIYEDGVLVKSYISSTGLPGLDTWRGNFNIQNKIPMAYASTWGLQMPYWLGFYWAGPLQNGFHALPIQPDGSVLWEGYLGTPVSYGCVILSLSDMRELYNWAEVGTPVTVRD